MSHYIRNTRLLAAAAIMACASFSAQAVVITTDGTTTSDGGVTYKSEFQGDVLTLSIFADTFTGNLVGASSLDQLTFSGMRRPGAAYASFFLNGATMTGASTQVGSLCNGSAGGGQICFTGLADAISRGAPLTYKIAFDYTGPPIDFDDFNLRATYTGQRLNGANRPVNFRAGELVAIDAKEAAEVPEPASLAIMGLGLGLLGFTARRKKKASK